MSLSFLKATWCFLTSSYILREESAGFDEWQSVTYLLRKPDLVPNTASQNKEQKLLQVACKSSSLRDCPWQPKWSRTSPYLYDIRSGPAQRGTRLGQILQTTQCQCNHLQKCQYKYERKRRDCIPKNWICLLFNPRRVSPNSVLRGSSGVKNNPSSGEDSVLNTTLFWVLFCFSKSIIDAHQMLRMTIRTVQTFWTIEILKVIQHDWPNFLSW